MKKFIRKNVTFCVILPLIIGLHIGWFALQQRYVPVSERHGHPIVEFYKKFNK